ncbi:hypothetical protein D3C80_2026120 [compost metagenome]
MLAPGGFHRGDEVLVVPGIDLAGAGDIGRIRKLLLEFRHQRAVGAILEAGGEDGRQFEVAGQVGQGQHVVLELVRIDIAYQRQ